MNGASASPISVLVHTGPVEVRVVMSERPRFLGNFSDVSHAEMGEKPWENVRAVFTVSRTSLASFRAQRLTLFAREIDEAAFDREARRIDRVRTTTCADLDAHPRTRDQDIQARTGWTRESRLEYDILLAVAQQRRRASTNEGELSYHPERPRRIAMRASRSASRTLMLWRLSCCFLPRATAISSLARLFLK